MTWGVIAWHLSIMWQQIETAPVDRDLELVARFSQFERILIL